MNYKVNIIHELLIKCIKCPNLFIPLFLKIQIKLRLSKFYRLTDTFNKPNLSLPYGINH